MKRACIALPEENLLQVVKNHAESSEIIPEVESDISSPWSYHPDDIGTNPSWE